MPVIKLLEKIKTGYRQLFPETVGTAVITATGNAQDDISSLQSKMAVVEKETVKFYKTEMTARMNENINVYTIDVDKDVLYEGYKFKILANKTNTNNNIKIGFRDYEIAVVGIINSGRIEADKIYNLIFMENKLYIENMFTEKVSLIFQFPINTNITPIQIECGMTNSKSINISMLRDYGLAEFEISVRGVKETSIFFPASLMNFNGTYSTRVYFINDAGVWKNFYLQLTKMGMTLSYKVTTGNVALSDQVTISAIRSYA